MKNILLAFLLSPLFLLSQNEINKPERPTYYAAYDSTIGVYHIGVTEPDQVTTSGQPSFTSSSDALLFLQSTSTLPVVYDTLPPIGELLTEGDIYEYQGRLVIVRQTHNRTIFEPSEVPALFAVWREDLPDQVLPWIVGEIVYPGTIREYLAINYECIQQHQTVVGQTPNLVPALWNVYTVPGDCPDWVQPTGAQDAYDVGDCVTYQGQEWTSTTPANVWAPGVFGWAVNP